MYSLEDVFNQALADDSCGGLDGVGYQGRISLGVKIIKDNETNEVQLLNTSYGERYREVSKNEYEVFKEKGWLFGCYSLSLTNYKRKLDTIENLIQECFAKKISDKQYRKLKTSRTNYLLKYNDARNKLNKLTNKIKQNGNS